MCDDLVGPQFETSFPTQSKLVKYMDNQAIINHKSNPKN